MKVYVVLVTKDMSKIPMTSVILSKTFRSVGSNSYMDIGDVELMEGKISQLTNLIYEKCKFSEAQKNLEFTFKFNNDELDPNKNLSDYDFKKEFASYDSIRITAHF